MHSLYLLVGALAVLVALLFLGLIVLLWGLRQLLIIGQQNDTMIILLEQVAQDIWRGSRFSNGLADDTAEALPNPERKLKLHRQGETYGPFETQYASSVSQGAAKRIKAAG